MTIVFSPYLRIPSAISACEAGTEPFLNVDDEMACVSSPMVPGTGITHPKN